MPVDQTTSTLMPNRRHIMLGAGLALALPFGRADAQTTTRPARIGWISTASLTDAGIFLTAINTGMADLGWRQGQDYVIEARSANGDVARIPALIEELRVAGVALLATNGPATRMVVEKAGALPVVYVFSADPILAGFTDSLSRPRGNNTGITLLMAELNGKRVELARELRPDLRQITLVASPVHAGEVRERQDLETTAARYGITVRHLPTPNQASMDAALAAIAADPPGTLMALPDPQTNANSRQLAEVAIAHRVPFLSGWTLFAENGALCTYGPRLTDSYRRLAYYIDRLLKGAKPGDLPIELPQTFELAINLKTAHLIGLDPPLSLLQRADVVLD